ncbi:MAG: hypothetical protein AAGG68_20495 [Bacteroidota bacterium]
MKKLFFLTLAVLGMVAFVNAQTADNLLDPTTISDGSNTLELSVDGNTNGAEFILQAQTGAGRTIFQLTPGTGDDRAFFNVLNNSDQDNTGRLRLGARGSYGVLSVSNAGSPSTSLTNLAIELDPNGNTGAEAFVVGANGFFSTGSPDVYAKIDMNGVETIEAKVQATVAAPDYVFAKDYDLRSLEEVEAYINENSHLPEIPSAAEFEADGIQLGKMSFDLLKKVEELTLYMIELKKENEALKVRVEQLEDK